MNGAKPGQFKPAKVIGRSLRRSLLRICCPDLEWHLQEEVEREDQKQIGEPITRPTPRQREHEKHRLYVLDLAC